MFLLSVYPPSQIALIRNKFLLLNWFLPPIPRREQITATGTLSLSSQFALCLTQKSTNRQPVTLILLSVYPTSQIALLRNKFLLLDYCTQLKPQTAQTTAPIPFKTCSCGGIQNANLLRKKTWPARSLNDLLKIFAKIFSRSS